MIMGHYLSAHSLKLELFKSSLNIATRENSMEVP